MILELFQWLQSLSFMTFIRESGLEYPIVMSTHLACIAVFGGMIVITDLRLLGVVLTERSIADVVNGLRWWKRIGFVIMFSMGFTLFGNPHARQSGRSALALPVDGGPLQWAPHRLL
jgi:hypothetical protein